MTFYLARGVRDWDDRKEGFFKRRWGMSSNAAFFLLQVPALVTLVLALIALAVER